MPRTASGNGVSWARSAWIILGVGALLVVGIGVLRGGGFDARDARVSSATRWFVNQTNGQVVLADGYGGRAIVRLDAGLPGAVGVAEGPSGAYVLDNADAQVREIDRANLRLGPAETVAPLADNDATSSVTDDGLVVVDNESGTAVLLSPDGQSTQFDVDTDGRTVIAPDSSVWSLDASRLVHTMPSGASSDDDIGGNTESELSAMGSVPIVFDQSRSRVRVGVDGRWIALDGEPSSEIVVQRPGPQARCAWLGANDTLWCVDGSRIVREVTVDGLDVEGSSQLAIAGDAAVVVRDAPASIVRFDWRTGAILDDDVASVPSGAQLEVSSVPDLVWVDDTAGPIIWAINPWGLNAISKDDSNTLLVGEDGEATTDGSSPSAGVIGSLVDTGDDTLRPDPDENGLDDPPVAVDDPVTARAGTPVVIPVTGNDYDPDGEAIAVSSAETPGHGTTVIDSASTISYVPDAGYSGKDQFDYTIVDGNGTEASATVIVQLLTADAVNQAPLANDDVATTRQGVPIDIDVLLNDVDPERDTLRIGEIVSLSESNTGTVSETKGPSGLPALHFTPADEFVGPAEFTYQAQDARNAASEPATVTVIVAADDEPNRAPETLPDATRVRRFADVRVPVLANDIDPDGDSMIVTVDSTEIPGVEVQVEGDQLVVNAGAGAASLVPFDYTVDDGHGGISTGKVLLQVLGAEEPNRPPQANADSDSVVLGRSVEIDVLKNDTDPDQDQLLLVSVDDVVNGQATVAGSRVRFTPSGAAVAGAMGSASFTYTITDGNGHEADAEVTVQVLAEPLAKPPWALDDSTSTLVDKAVTIDVLANDGDPSGDQPTVRGNPSCPSGGTVSVDGAGRVVYLPPAKLTGVFRCRYEIVNSQGLIASAVIVISVQAAPVVNQPPVTVDDEIKTSPGEPKSVDVLANDFDPEGDPMVVQPLTSSASGLATLSGSVITVTPPANIGVYAITYQVADDAGGVSTGRLVVRVLAPDPVPPIANDDGSVVFSPTGPVTFDVLTNDIGDSLRIDGASLTGGSGTVTTVGNSVILTPAEGFVGVLSAQYRIHDAQDQPASATVSLTVLPPLNRAPSARDDAAEVRTGASVTVDVLGNDFDPDGNQLTLTVVSPPTSGVAVVANGRIRYTSVAPFAGQATIGYQVSDGEFTADATLRIQVVGCTTTPQANDVSLRTGYQQSIAIDLNPSASGGSITSVGQPLGQAVGVYTPPAGENGNVVFQYVVSDECGAQAVGTVTIDVNQDPVAGAITVPIAAGSTQSIPVSQLATDAEPLTIVELQGAPAWATSTGTTLEVAPTVPGAATFTVVVRDPGGLTGRATVTIDVVNRAPIANDDAVDVSTGPTVVDVLANDSDPDGNGVQLQSFPETITFDGGGTASVSDAGGGTLRIVPARAAGTATFQYTIRDSFGLVSNEATVVVTARGPDPTVPPTTTVPPTEPPTEPPTTTTTEPTTTTTTTEPTTTTTTTEPPTTTTTTEPPTTTTVAPPPIVPPGGNGLGANGPVGNGHGPPV